MQVIKINSFEEYSDFISELAAHPLYYDPHFVYDKGNLYGALNKKNEFAFAVLKDGNIEGLFVWLVIPDEKYIEMLIGFTKNSEAFLEMLSYMEREYRGYKADFVINPKNSALCEILKAKGAIFEAEQQRMIQKGKVPDVTTRHIELYTEKWKEQYCNLHNTDTYWTAERVILAGDRFRILLAINDGEIVGYLDVTYGLDINEPYDLFVKPEFLHQGYELALLKKAIELNGQNKMMVMADVDDLKAIEIYNAAGFEKAEGQNSIYATYNFA